MKHGTRAMYTDGGCRCDECKSAERKYRAEYYASHREKERRQRALRYWQAEALVPFTRTRQRRDQVNWDFVK